MARPYEHPGDGAKGVASLGICAVECRFGQYPTIIGASTTIVGLKAAPFGQEECSDA
jgi:hypothetical protein